MSLCRLPKTGPVSARLWSKWLSLCKPCDCHWLTIVSLPSSDNTAGTVPSMLFLGTPVDQISSQNGLCLESKGYLLFAKQRKVYITLFDRKGTMWCIIHACLADKTVSASANTLLYIYKTEFRHYSKTSIMNGLSKGMPLNIVCSLFTALFIYFIVFFPPFWIQQTWGWILESLLGMKFFLAAYFPLIS